MRIIYGFTICTVFLLSACSTTSPSVNVSVNTPNVSTGTATTLTGAEQEKEKDMASGTISTFSLSEVKKHATTSDCYTTVNGKVYNVTAFFGRHPGGDPNLSRVCGIDATEIFTQQHGGKEKPEKMLQSFYIGTLLR